MKHTAAIILAAGKGSRMHSKIAKQFMLLDDKPVIYYSLQTFIQAGIEEIILVTSEEYIEFCQKEIVDKYALSRIKTIIPGGKERYESVYEGLKEISDDKEIVYIHDGARPFVTEHMIKSCYQSVLAYGACVAGVPVKDTIKVVDKDGIALHTPDRSALWQIQTPQVFEVAEIRKAYQQMMQNGDMQITDDAMVMEKYGKKKIAIVEGDYKNIKITTPEDILIANAYIEYFKNNGNNS